MARETWWIKGGEQGEIRRLLDVRGLTSVAAVMAVAEKGEILSTDRNSAAVRLPGTPPLLVKWRRPRHGRRRRTFHRASRERREARALMKAPALGIEAPPVWAVGERRRRGVLLGSCLIRPWITGHVAASSLLLDVEGHEAADQLARTLRAWHDAGFRHGDCYPKNVLVDPVTLSASPIGCPAARFVRPGAHGDKTRWKDLAQWTVGLDLLHAEAAAESFPASYLAGTPAWIDESTLLGHLEAPRSRILRKKAARLASLLEREPDGPPLPAALANPTRPVERRIRPLHKLIPRGR